jgi:hypothetical protein
MSPTSCRCSTPRHESIETKDGTIGVGGCPQRPRLPQGRPCSTLRRCGGSRPGSGWDRVGPARSRPRAPPTRHREWATTPPYLRHRPRRRPPGPGPRPRAPCTSGSLSVWCPAPPWRWGCAWGVGPTPAGAGRPGTNPQRVRAPGHAAPGHLWVLRPRPLGRLGSSRLPAVHLPPIDPVISRGPYLQSSGATRLGEGFPLRCFQRFARPHVATQRCRLPDNWHTSGASTPVLSY